MLRKKRRQPWMTCLVVYHSANSYVEIHANFPWHKAIYLKARGGSLENNELSFQVQETINQSSRYLSDPKVLADWFSLWRLHICECISAPLLSVLNFILNFQVCSISVTWSENCQICGTTITNNNSLSAVNPRRFEASFCWDVSLKNIMYTVWPCWSLTFRPKWK